MGTAMRVGPSAFSAFRESFLYLLLGPPHDRFTTEALGVMGKSVPITAGPAIPLWQRGEGTGSAKQASGRSIAVSAR
jgi:hypothetical protein